MTGILLAFLFCPAARAAQPDSTTTPVAAADVAAFGAAFGAALDASDAFGLSVLSIVPGSRADDLGLKAGDALLSLEGAPTRSIEEVSSAVRRWAPGTRLWAVARRAESVVALAGSQPPPQRPYARDASELSARETALKRALLDKAAADALASVRQAPSLDLKVAARQAFWLGFPDGVPDAAAAGDALVGETTTAVATSQDLDFLSLPARSRVWCRVVSAKKGPETRELRLFIFKVQPEGGHVYPATGWITAITGDQNKARVSSGGTIVASLPTKPTKGAASSILAADARLRAELAASITLTEAAPFYRAGPGLWIRTKDTPYGRRFEITHVIAGRSAALAGVKVGDVVDSIAGKAAARLDFAGALGLIYGEPGAKVRLRVAGRDLELTRGVIYREGRPVPLPLPYEK